MPRSAPGKRLRPFLVLASAQLFAVARGSALQAAAAVELVACLFARPRRSSGDGRQRSAPRPADLPQGVRRGDGRARRRRAPHPGLRSAGRARDTHGDPAVRCELVTALAQAAGANGMVGGQMIDLIAEHRPDLDMGAITRLQRLKTGALIAFACEAGRDPRQGAGRAAAGAAGLCARSRPGVPDRRRSPRRAGLARRDRQAGASGCGGGQGDFRLDSRGRTRAGAGATARSTRRLGILNCSVIRRTFCDRRRISS